MKKDHDYFEELMALRTAGMLEYKEVQALNRHISSCRRCQELSRSFRSVDILMDRAFDGRKDLPVQYDDVYDVRRPAGLKYAAIAAGILLAVGVFCYFSGLSSRKSEISPVTAMHGSYPGGEQDKAVTTYDTSIEETLAQARVKLDKLTAENASAEAYTSVIESLNEILARERIFGRDKLTANKMLAEAYEEAGDFWRHWESFTAHLELLEDRYGWKEAAGELQGKGNDLFSQSNFTRSMVYYDAVMARYPDTEEAREAQFQIGRAYLNEREWKEAQRQFERILAEAPGSDLAPGAMERVAISQLNSGDTDTAIGTFNKMAKRYPEKAAKAKFHVAVLYYHRALSDPIEVRAALNVLEDIKAKHPGTDEARYASQMIAELKGKGIEKIMEGVIN